MFNYLYINAFIYGKWMWRMGFMHHIFVGNIFIFFCYLTKSIHLWNVYRVKCVFERFYLSFVFRLVCALVLLALVLRLWSTASSVWLFWYWIYYLSFFEIRRNGWVIADVSSYARGWNHWWFLLLFYTLKVLFLIVSLYVALPRLSSKLSVFYVHFA